MKITKIHKGGRPKRQRVEYDLGTPELIKHRAMSCPQDPTLSTCPIDSMLGRGHLSAEEHGALTHFRALRKIVFGSPSVHAVDLNMVSYGSPDEPEESTAEQGYRRACSVLLRDGELVFKTMERIVVHEHWPQWLPLGHEKNTDWEAVLFKRGLNILCDWSRGT